jgi:hypothetical protein
VLIGSSANGVTINASTHQVTYSGTAQHVKEIQLTAEYAGAVLNASGSNNTGSMTSGYDTTDTPNENYYQWTTSQSSQQSYDVIVQVPLPSDFTGFSSSTPITINSWSNNASSSGNVISATLKDTSGSSVSGFGSSGTCALTPSSSGTTYTVTNCNLTTGSNTFAANGYITLDIHLASPTAGGGEVRLGNIAISYESAF